ncbi:MAG: diacylglycerol/lipid kinase family protein [Anaerolineae bacterium]
MQALFIYNPVAGQTSVERELAHCLDVLARHGWNVDLTTTDRPRHATELARRAATSGAGMVVAVGGDGTVGEVANGLVGTDTILGVIPAGTSNVWALQMGIPALPAWHPRKVVDRVLSDMEELGWHRPIGIPSWLSEAFETMLSSEVRQADTGLIAGRTFLMWCGVGFDAKVTEAVVPEERRRYGLLAWLASGISTAVEYSSARMQLVMPGREMEDDVLMIVGSNMRLYGGIVRMAPSAYLDDGLLDVLVFRGTGIGNIVRHVTALLAGRHPEEANVDYLQVDSLSVASFPSQPVHADDEVCGATPVDITVQPLSLRVLIPPGPGGELFCRPPLGLVRDFG